jgi:predicted dehydrogenase
MRIGIIGAGVIGHVHARLIDSLADSGAVLAAVVDIDEQRSNELAQQYGAKAYTDLGAALADPDLDAFSVCVPSGLHPEIAVRVIDAGRSVLIEKPLAITMAGAEQVAAAAEQADVTVGVVSQRRFQPPVRFIRSAIDGGLLGRVTSAVVESPFFRSQDYYDSGDWRGTLALDGGGALMNQGIHALDLLVWMLGRPVKVSAHTGCVAHTGIEVEDVVGATITFESGAIGVLLASTAANPGLPVRLAVHGDRGVVVMDDERITRFESTVEDAAAVAVPDGHPHPGREDWGPLDEAHRAQYADFLRSAGERTQPYVTLADGTRSLAVVLAIYESARSGRAVEI